MIKKLRYNLIVLGLIAIVGCYIGMTFFMSKPSRDTSGNADSNQNIEQNVVVDPSMDEVPDGDVTLPTDMWERIAYAFDVMENGEGYTSNFFTQIVNTALGSIEVTQKSVGVVNKGVNSRGEKVAVEENYFYTDGKVDPLAANMVENRFKGFYTNFATNQTQVAITSSYNKNAAIGKKYDELSYDLTKGLEENQLYSTQEVIDKYKIIKTMPYPVEVKKGSAVYTNQTTKGNLVTYKFNIDLSSLSQDFKDFFSSTGAMKNIKYSSVKLEITINTKNCYLTKIVRTESLSGRADIANASVTTEVTTTQIFTSMNKEVVLGDNL